MNTEITALPTRAEMERFRIQARQMQSETIRAALRAVVRWIAHPSLRPSHAQA